MNETINGDDHGILNETFKMKELCFVYIKGARHTAFFGRAVDVEDDELYLITYNKIIACGKDFTRSYNNEDNKFIVHYWCDTIIKYYRSRTED